VSTETSDQHHPTHDPARRQDPQGRRRPRFSFSDELVKERSGASRASSATTGPAPDQGQARRPRLCRRRFSARSAEAAGADGWSYRPRFFPRQLLCETLATGLPLGRTGRLLSRIARSGLMPASHASDVQRDSSSSVGRQVLDGGHQLPDKNSASGKRIRPIGRVFRP